ncbi:conserved hypothetical protein, secreted [Candidatus Magnetomorum sp. HK-1]|nr:conserved hypothetical protein, secreted [Candidatus Magnetomorum sp. HK-1]
MRVKLALIILSIIIIPFVSYSEENKTEINKEPPQNEEKKVPNPSDSPKKTIDQQIENLTNQQTRQNKSLQILIKTLNIQSTNQKSFQSKVDQSLQSLQTFQSQMNDEFKQLANSQKGKDNADSIKSLNLEINTSLESLRADLSSALSDTVQNNLKTLNNYQLENEKQINSLVDNVKAFQQSITTDQAKKYSTITASMTSVHQRVSALADQLTQFAMNFKGKDEVNVQKILTEKFSSNQDILTEQFSNHQEILKSMEAKIQDIVNKTSSQLNSEISNTIKELKTDLSRLQQTVSDEIDKINGQVMEVKHEQQVQLESFTKQILEEIKKHDQNISNSIIIVEKSSNSNYLTWLIYSLIFIIICLFVFIIWDRMSTVAPLISRIRRLEDNLVIEY